MTFILDAIGNTTGEKQLVPDFNRNWYLNVGVVMSYVSMAIVFLPVITL